MLIQSGDLVKKNIVILLIGCNISGLFGGCLHGHGCPILPFVKVSKSIIVPNDRGRI